MTAVAPAVRIDGPRAIVEFDRFTLAEYDLFLKVKKLPESQISYDWETDRYQVSTPARFAARLGVPVSGVESARIPFADHLFDYQKWVLDLALDARRFALWIDTGLGKGPVHMEWERQVQAITGGRVLTLCPPGLIPQEADEIRKFYGDRFAVEYLDSREKLAAWCKAPGTGVGVASTWLFARERMPELRYLAGLVLEESSILKTGGGKIKWNLIHSAKGIEYKLSCTATPAPNDAMEYASQAAFLEKITTEGDILWTYFSRNKQGDWTVKPWARDAFYEFMASWSIYMRDPSHFGFNDILADLPVPEIHEYRLEMTEAQQARFYELQTRRGGWLFADERLGITERSKFSQLAKGFEYDGKPGDRKIIRTDSRKPEFITNLIRQETDAGRQVLVWTVFDAETDILGAGLMGLTDLRWASFSGATKDDERNRILQAFRAGELDVLISKPSLIGYGLNFQQCRSMIFSGFDDSFERMYQAIRRAYRFGQTETVHVHIPYIPDLEGLMWTNVKSKESRFLADVDAQEAEYRKVLGRMV